MPISKPTDSLVPFRRRARWRQVWRWLRWVLLVLVVATLLLGGVLLRLGMADTGISLASRDGTTPTLIYTQATITPDHDGGHA
ncbi:MAG: hypothetical protein HC828_04005 [Blastochloris sp.]|nr:hypothetical protein [Blastochloris sp.]